MTALDFLDRVGKQDVSSAVSLLKTSAFKQKGSFVPVWNETKSKVERRSVSDLAGLLCYADPVEQTKGLEIAHFFTQPTRNLITNCILAATDLTEKGTEQIKLAQMMQ